MLDLIKAWLLAGVMPRDAVRWAERRGVWAALVGHAIWAGVCALWISLLIARVDAGGDGSWAQAWETLGEWCASIYDVLTRPGLAPAFAILWSCVTIAMFHAGLALSALGSSVWTARADGRAAAYKRAWVRTLWFTCPAGVLITLVVALVVFISIVQDAYWTPYWRMNQYFIYPGQVTSPTPQQLAIHQAMQQVYNDARQMWQDNEPWIISDLGDVLMALLFTMLLLAIPFTHWAMMIQRGAAGPYPAHSRWPAVCEGCGYTLYDVKVRPQCPECGKAATDSVGEEVRPGPRGLGVAGVAKLWLFGWLRPKRLGQRLAGRDGSGTHIRLTLVACLLAFVISAVAWPVYHVFEQASRWGYVLHYTDTTDFVIPGIVFGGLSVAAVLGLSTGTPGLTGFSQTGRLKTGLMPVAALAGGWMSGMLIWWLVSAWVGALLVTLTYNLEWHYWLAHALRIDRDYVEALPAFAFLGFNLICLFLYASAVHRAVVASRYSNR